MDRAKGIATVMLAQLLPSGDPAVIGAYFEAEGAVYAPSHATRAPLPGPWFPFRLRAVVQASACPSQKLSCLVRGRHCRYPALARAHVLRALTRRHGVHPHSYVCAVPTVVYDTE